MKQKTSLSPPQWRKTVYKSENGLLNKTSSFVVVSGKKNQPCVLILCNCSARWAPQWLKSQPTIIHIVSSKVQLGHMIAAKPFEFQKDNCWAMRGTLPPFQHFTLCLKLLLNGNRLTLSKSYIFLLIKKLAKTAWNRTICCLGDTRKWGKTIIFLQWRRQPRGQHIPVTPLLHGLYFKRYFHD